VSEVYSGKHAFYPNKNSKIFLILFFQILQSRLLKALGSCSPENRCVVPGRYYQMFGKNLVDVVKSECGSKVFGTALQYFALDPVHAECEMVEDACQGFGTNEIFLFSIICGRSNQEIALLKVCN
jgi:hypothetical protein